MIDESELERPSISSKRGKNSLRLTCPFCGGFFRIRTSSKLSLITVKALGECQGCTYRGYLSITHDSMAFPSDHPNAEKARVNLPVTDYMIRFAKKTLTEGFQATHRSTDEVANINCGEMSK